MHLLLNVFSVSDTMILFTLTFLVLHYTVVIVFMIKNKDIFLLPWAMKDFLKLCILK